MNTETISTKREKLSNQSNNTKQHIYEKSKENGVAESEYESTFFSVIKQRFFASTLGEAASHLYKFIKDIALPNLLKYKRAGKDTYLTIILVISSVPHQTEKSYNMQPKDKDPNPGGTSTGNSSK